MAWLHSADYGGYCSRAVLELLTACWWRWSTRVIEAGSGKRDLSHGPLPERRGLAWEEQGTRQGMWEAVCRPEWVAHKGRRDRRFGVKFMSAVVEELAWVVMGVWSSAGSRRGVSALAAMRWRSATHVG